MNASADRLESGGQDEQRYQLSVDEALALAVQLQRSNRLPQAEELYRTVLEADPERVEALHFLGVLRHQTGHSEEGAELIARAIAQRPDYFDCLTSPPRPQSSLSGR